MKNNKRGGALILAAASLLFSMSAVAQTTSTTVSFDPSVKRLLGKKEVSELQRNIYFNFHSAAQTDKDIKEFTNEYDVGFGRGFWGPYSYAYSKTKEVGKYPSFKADTETDKRPVSRYVSTEHPNLQVIKHGAVDPKAAGQWASDYFGNKSVSGDVVPEFFEPLNEPFVHASDNIFSPATQAQMKTLMTEFFREIGKSIDENPRLADMKVVGYASAWPSMELNSFGHWEDNMKRFIDGAGEYIDGISVHLYDGINVTGVQTRRSGSNSEAILDLVEAYTYIKYGEPRPLAITEYGCIDDTENEGYSEIANSRTVGSINHILFNMLDRQDNMLISIPFLTDKSTWHLTEANDYIPYGPVIFLPDDPTNPKTTSWYLSQKAQFFTLWKDVRGNRIDVQTSNPDVQVHGFRDGNKIYVAMDNLDDFTQEVDLQSAVDWGKYSNIYLRTLISSYEKGIIYEERAFDPRSEKINLEVSQVSILVADVAVDEAVNRVVRTKYYSQEYLQPIASGKTIDFNYTNVETGYGRATLRMSVGRDLKSSKVPTSVKVNGIEIDIPTNWKGYDQEERGGFFGMIELPFPITLLKSGANSVSFTFATGGGHIAAAILQVDKYDANPYGFSSQIANGGFENGDAAGWIPWSTVGYVDVKGGDVNEGQYSAHISGGAGLSQIVATEPNCDYRFTADIKVVGGKAQMGVKLDGVTAVESTSSSFTTQSVEFNSGSNDQVRLYIDAPTAWDDQIVVDNVSVEKIEK